MWRNINLGQNIDVISGFAFSSSEFNDEENGLPLIRIRDIDAEEAELYYSGQYQEAFVVNRGDVLVGMDGEFNIHKWKGSKALLNQRVLMLQEKRTSELDLTFSYYWLSPFLKDVEHKTAATTVKHLTSKEVKNAELFAPKKSIQQKIGAILQTTDSAIEKTQTLIAKYENIKQGMMQDLFSRGVDENGQIRPSYEDAPHLYQETELGWIPNDWVTEELRYYVPRAEYGVSIGCDDNAENIPVLRMNNIFNGEFEVSDLKYAPASELKGLFLKEKDVLFNRTNSWEHVGKTAIWKNQLAEASFASYMVRLVPDVGLMIPEYLSYWLQLDDVQTAIRTFATPGVQQVNINPTNLRRTLCSAPKDTNEQMMIVSRVQAIDEKLEKEREILGKLQSQKLGLMQDLLTGKVRVADDMEERKESVA